MAGVATMDFFESQETARRKTGLLVFYYVLAVFLIMVAVYAAFAFAFLGIKAKARSSRGEAEIRYEDMWNPTLFMGVIAGTLLVVISGSLYKIHQLSGGGEAVAQLLGGRPLSRNTTDLNERKFLNVVEEMAVASGTPVPRVFLLDQEQGINAFAAGFSPADAVIGVTRGCIQQLTRDELQGVVAHEFSHILNGDMRLNIRLIGVLNGILVVALIGYGVMRATLYSGSRTRSRDKGSGMHFALFGLLLMVIGYVGVFFGKLIKSAVSRQREYLADASAVQFTRNPSGIADALKKIGACVQGSRIENSSAEEASHFFFSNGLKSSFINLMATHPPLAERIRRLDPAFEGDVRRANSGRPGPSSSAPVEAVSGLSRFAVDPGEVTARIGAPQAEHLAYAVGVLAALPDMVQEAAREPFGARAVIYSLLLGRGEEVCRRQLERLKQHADAAV